MNPFPDVLGPWTDWKKRQWKHWPVRTNRASQLGGDCERELVYWRTRWQEAEPVEFTGQLVMAEGQKHEETVLEELRKAGLVILEQQAPLDWPEFEISGHIDAVVLHEGHAVPLDVKSMAPWIWSATFRRGMGRYAWAEVADAFQARSWLRKYLGQLVCYMLLKECELGLLLCLNKSTGELAQVDVELDYAEGEKLLQRAERINFHVKAESLPKRIPYEPDVCPRCPFYSLCLPDQAGQDPLQFVREERVESWLQAREDAQEGAQRFQEADKQLKAWAKARPEDRLVVGNYLLEKKTARNGAVRLTVKQVEGNGQ